MTLLVKSFQELSAAELYEILKSRFHVFVMEQHCFYLDMDNTDFFATHVFLCDESHTEITEQGVMPMPVVAYARLYQAQDDNVWHIGRMLTLVRKQGLGKQLMNIAIRLIKDKKAKRIEIDAQQHAIGFYEKLGFRVVSEPFDEAGIVHVKMTFDDF